MLLQLSIENFAVIQQTTLELGKGLNVVSGETGAGKSLVVQALLGALGRKLDRDIVRQGEEKASIEGIFQYDSSANQSLKELLTSKQIDIQDDVLILRREIRRSGTSMCWINNRAISQGMLREVGLLLADVHVQGEYTDLVRTEKQLELLDSFGDLNVVKNKVVDLVKKVRFYEEEKFRIESSKEQNSRYQELIKFQLEEIEQANLQAGEEESLLEEREFLQNALRLQEVASQCYHLLKEGDVSAVDYLSECINFLEKAPDPDNYLKSQIEKLTEMLNSLEQISRDLRIYGEERQANPERLLQVEKRLELIVKLTGKYGGNVEQVLKTQQKLAGEQRTDEENQNTLQAINHAMGVAKKSLSEDAQKLSQRRERAASKLAKEVTFHLRQLGMQNTRFTIEIYRQPGDEGITLSDGITYHCMENGVDRIEFLISTNPGVPMRPMNKVASGGEISRILLALKNALQENTGVPVLVFDEIDTGVGAKAGNIVGQKLWKTGRHHQVICVTHLPQIAAFGDQHHCVKKSQIDGHSSADVYRLTKQDRNSELALMLGGSTSPASLKTALELLNMADKEKKNLS